MPRPIGFIGVGTMGKPMARNLLKASYPVTVFDLDPAPVDFIAERRAGGPGPGWGTSWAE